MFRFFKNIHWKFRILVDSLMITWYSHLCFFISSCVCEKPNTSASAFLEICSRHSESWGGWALWPFRWLQHITWVVKKPTGMFNMSSPLFLFECRAKSISKKKTTMISKNYTLVTLRSVRELGLPYPFKASLFETNSKQPCCHASDLRIRIYNDQNSPGLPCSRWYWPTVLTKRRHHGPQYLARYGHGIMEITYNKHVLQGSAG